MKTYMKKFIASFCIYLMISMTFAIALTFAPISEDAKEKITDSIDLIPNAAATGICVVNMSNNQFCYEKADNSDNTCLLYRSSGTVENNLCTPGVCVDLESGVCSPGVVKQRCEANNLGKWYANEASAGGKCDKVCCISPNNATCMPASNLNGYTREQCTKMGWTVGPQSDQQCKNICAPTEYGCCKKGESYINLHRSECPDTPSEPFYGHENYCSSVPGSGVRACTNIGKGDGSTDGDKANCYCYDSTNKREGIATNVNNYGSDGNLTSDKTGDCAANGRVCKDPDDLGKNPAFCKSTNCVDFCQDCSPQTFKNGESLCMNVNPGFFNPGARSSYLQNYVLRCNEGDIVADTSWDPNATREILCVDVLDTTKNKTTVRVQNQYQKCLECGNDNGALDILGYIPVLGPFVATVLSGKGSMCKGTETGFGEECNHQGEVPKTDFLPTNYQLNTELNTKLKDPIQMCDGGSGSYDNDLWAPIGSCNPVYPPGTIQTNKDRCSKACGFSANGGGGDAVTNPCTEEECEHLGDCQFYPEAFPSQGFVTMALSSLTAITIGYGICKALAFLSIGTCEGGFVAVGKMMVAGHSAILFWGAYAIIFGVTASYTSQVQTYKMELVNGKVPMGTAIQFAKMAQRNPDVGSNFWQGNLGAAGEPIIGTAGTIGVVAASAWIIESYATLTASAITGLLLIGALVPTYFAAKALNAGTCNPESPMSIDDKKKYYPESADQICEQCGWGEGQPYCTQQRCGILGENCNWTKNMTATKEDGICMTMPPAELIAPVITFINASYYETNESSGILGSDSGTTEALRPLSQELNYNMSYVKIAVTTDEKSYCSWSMTPGQSMDNLSAYQGFPNEYIPTKNHETDFIPIDRTILPQTYTYYVKCKDMWSNKPDALQPDRYKVTFRVQEGPDVTPPARLNIDPKGSLSYTANSFDLSIIVYDKNGVQSCGYLNSTKDADGNYTNFTPMEHLGTNVACVGTENIVMNVNKCDFFKSTVRMKPLSQIVCVDYMNLDLDHLAEGVTLTESEKAQYNQLKDEYNGTMNCQISVRCTDTKDNTAEFNSSLFASPSFGSNISIIGDKDSSGNLFDKKPTILVGTNRTCWCNYTMDGKSFVFNDPVEGTKVHSLKHPEELSSSASGTLHTVNVLCRDVFKAPSAISQTFRIYSESADPQIIRVYKETSTRVHLVTDKDAMCVSVPDCESPSYSEGTSTLSTVPEKDHYYQGSGQFYVMCKGRWQENSTVSTCSTIKPLGISSGGTSNILTRGRNIGGIYSSLFG